MQYKAVFDATLDIVDELSGWAACKTGPTPTQNSMSAYVVTDPLEQTYLDKGTQRSMNVTLLAKHQRQDEAIAVLSKICADIACKFDYPISDVWEITDISVSSGPMYVDLEDSGQYLYTCSLQIFYYILGGLD